MSVNAIEVVEIATPFRPDFSAKELLVAAWEEWMKTEGSILILSASVSYEIAGESIVT